MSRIFCVLTLFLCLFPSVAAGKDKVSFFAKVKCDRPVVNRGDSCLVSVILYGTSPFFYMEKGSFKNAQELLMFLIEDYKKYIEANLI